MPAERLSMRTIREVLRLKWGEAPDQPADRRELSDRPEHRPGVPGACREGGPRPGPFAAELDDTALERLLFPSAVALRPRRPALDGGGSPGAQATRGDAEALMARAQGELPQGYQYTQFCVHYRQWKATLDLCLRQDYRAGEKLFVDYAGLTIPVVDPATGQPSPAYLFVATLGASNYTFAEASRSQSLPDWIERPRAGLRLLRRRARHRACPTISRPASPRPAATSPISTPPTTRWPGITGRSSSPPGCESPRTRPRWSRPSWWSSAGSSRGLRNRTLLQPRGAQRRRLRRSSSSSTTAPFQKLTGYRDGPLRDPRPAGPEAPAGHPYEYAEWKKARVNIDYHIELDGHYYSVPYQLVKEQVELRMTVSTVEILFKGRPGGLPPTQCPAGRPHDGSFAHAQGPSALPGVDPVADPCLGRTDRSEDRSPGGLHPGVPQASRAGLPELPGHPEAGKTLQSRDGSRPPAPAGLRVPRLELSQRREHPQDGLDQQASATDDPVRSAPSL